MNLLTVSIVKCVLSLLFCLNLFSAATRLSLRGKFNSSEFVHKLTNRTVNLNHIYSATLDEMPTLSGEKLSYSFTTLEPCSMNSFHLHPRASELLFVIEGENLQVGFIEENGGRTILNNIEAGHATLYPKGLIHFEHNLGCAQVRYLSAMNNDDPGLIIIINRVLEFPSLAMQTTFNVSQCQYLNLKNNLPVNQLVNGMEDCKKRCNKKKRWV